jgi:site-specific recombinase XerD
MLPSISTLLRYEREGKLTRKTSKAFDEDNIPLSVPSPPDSWDEALAVFESDLYRLGRAETTVSSYTYALRAFGAFYRGQLRKPGPYVARLQENDFQAFIHYVRHERHLSAVYVNCHIAALRAFATFILAKGWHRRMVAGDLKTYPVNSIKSRQALSASEERLLVKAVDLNGRNGLRDLAILQLFLQCGLQVSELVRLLRDDATIHKSVGRLRVRNEKRDQERTVPLNSIARKALNDYLKAQGSAVGGAPLFLSERRGRLSVAAVQFLIKKYLCFAGREDLSTYDLRVHFASKFYAKSGNLPATQKILGQRNITTTARYAKATEREIEEACDALDDRSE